MSKSILVIDTPERCLDCPCHFTGMIRINPSGKERHIHISCGIRDKDIMSDEVKPDWCPLHEVPPKKDKIEIKRNCDYEANLYASAYNTAIDEILKGSDEHEQ